MSQILIAYQSYDGQSERIANVMAETIKILGHEPVLRNLADKVATKVEWKAYRGVILGGPIHRGVHAQCVQTFVKTNLEMLNRIPTAFFSVSLSAAGNDSQKDDAQRCLEEFLDDAGLNAVDTIIVAGALKYRKYGFFKRLMMRWIARRAGSSDLDTSQDYEYTNWQRVTAFVERFVSTIGLKSFGAIEPVDRNQSQVHQPWGACHDQAKIDTLSARFFR